MKKVALLIFIGLIGGLGYWYYDTNRFHIPDNIIITPWAMQHSAEQLSILQNKISVSDIQKAFEHTKDKAVVYFQIKDGKVVSQTGSENLRKVTYFKVFEYVLQNFASKGFLKNNHFLVLLSDETKQVSLPEGLQHIPIFVFAKDLKYHGNFKHLLIVDSYTLKKWLSIYEELQKEKPYSPWNLKKNKIFWRGNTSDGGEERVNSPRIHLVQMSVDHSDLIDARFFKIHAPKSETTDRIKKELPSQASFVSPSKHLYFKYQITLDGVTATFPGYLWRQASKCLNIKQESTSVQWFYDLFKENVHYISVKRNLENLLDVLNYAKEHDEDMEKIAENANVVVERELTPPHVFGYFVQLLNTYSNFIEF